MIPANTTIGTMIFAYILVSNIGSYQSGSTLPFKVKQGYRPSYVINFIACIDNDGSHQDESSLRTNGEIVFYGHTAIHFRANLFYKF